jgi:hypothetical protein
MANDCDSRMPGVLEAPSATVECAYCYGAIPCGTFTYVSAAKQTLSAVCPQCDRRMTVAAGSMRVPADVAASCEVTPDDLPARGESIWDQEVSALGRELSNGAPARAADCYPASRPSGGVAEARHRALEDLESLARHAIATALDRDVAAASRDRAARRRDEFASLRDLASADDDLDGDGVHTGRAVREASVQDRWAAAVDREHAARDRDLAAGDRALLITDLGSTARRRAIVFDGDVGGRGAEDV